MPCRARFWLFCTLGVSFWFVVGEINPLRQYVAKKYTCIDLASNFLQIFRMQILFPRPGGGTIAAGNRDRYQGFDRNVESKTLYFSRWRRAISFKQSVGPKKRRCPRNTAGTWREHGGDMAGTWWDHGKSMACIKKP